VICGDTGLWPFVEGWTASDGADSRRGEPY
jgi:hypothetical protein